MHPDIAAELSASPVLQGLEIRVFPGTDATVSACQVRAQAELALTSLLNGDYEDLSQIDG